MSKMKQTTDEEKRINLRSFIIGMIIALALIVLYTVFYFAGLIK